MRFFHPEFTEDLLNNIKDDVVGCGLVVEVPPKSRWDKYLVTHWHVFRLSEIFKLVTQRILLALKGVSVRAALNRHKIPILELHAKINTPEVLDQIRKFEPDVIVSSNSLIFKKDLLALPKICCLNRHSALLPAYGGLWPAFHAYRNGESFTGVSVHTMEEKIDGGIVLAQEPVPIMPGDSIFDLYKKCFDVSAKVVIAALDKVRANDFSSVPNAHIKPSYYSFPTSEDWKQFRRRGGKFV